MRLSLVFFVDLSHEWASGEYCYLQGITINYKDIEHSYNIHWNCCSRFRLKIMKKSMWSRAPKFVKMRAKSEEKEQNLWALYLPFDFNYFACAYTRMTTYTAFSRSCKVDCLPARRSQSFSDLSSLPFRSSWRHHRGLASLACLTSYGGCQGRRRLKDEKNGMSERCKLIRELELKWMENKWGRRVESRAEQNRAEQSRAVANCM